MTLQEQVTSYWMVQRCWHNPELAVKHKVTFGYTVKQLRAIIDAPKTPRLKELAQALLNDVVANTVSPEVPETPPKLYGKQASGIILDDVARK